MPKPGVQLLGPRGEPLRVTATRPVPTEGRRQLQARYDSARTTDENRRHWAGADGLSARAANTAEVRYRLRTRARYEVANNSYAKGIVLTQANDVVGTGPRLQMLTDDPTLNRQVERSFERWTAAVGLAETLRTKRQARSVDGESFGLLTTNPRVGHEVKLQLRLVEADQVATPDLATNDPLAVDGIRFDRWMNPTEYHLLAAHPGDDFGWSHQYDRIPARFVIHWFRADRPGQLRGVPEITPALGLFAQLRRYTLAVLSAAETAADFAAVLYSDMPAMAESMEGREFDLLEIERRMMTTLPAGWKMAQFKPEQPTTTYEMFKREILKEIARCLNMPRNVAQGDSSGYNYASGRLDHQVYFKSIGVDQYHCETTVLDPLLGAWLAEASGATDLLGGLSPAIADWPHRWYWDGHEHVDPAKEATAAETRLRNHTTTLAEEYARRGLDWETQLRQRAKELELMRTLGLSPADAAPPATRPDPQPTGGGDADSEDDD